MSDFQFKCGSESRKKMLQEGNEQGAVNNHLKNINGIDYIEIKRVVNTTTDDQNSIDDGGSGTNTSFDVSSSEKNTILILLFLFKEAEPKKIRENNVIILGGTRIRNITIELAGKPEPEDILNELTEKEREIINSLSPPKRKKLIAIRCQEGDFSRYILKLVKDKTKPEELLPNFDPIFSQIDFSFKVDCALNFDCKFEKRCQTVTFKEPLLDYMAKDYASFVKLVLSRFSHVMPDWKEKSAADLINVLVELLAYVGDHLSYYQDAIATEAYLGTARKRISIRRHARLLDYFIHEGSNARTWVYFKVFDRGVVLIKLEKSTKVLTGELGKNGISQTVSEKDFKTIVSEQQIQIFETLHDVYLFSSNNEIQFYTWGETDCCLPKGATHATLLVEDIHIFSWETILNNESDKEKLKNFIMKISSVFSDTKSIIIDKVDDDSLIMRVDKENRSNFISITLSNDKAIAKDNNENIVYEFIAKKITNETQIYCLSINAGDVLIFEEKFSPTTFNESDIDPYHRQAVKLRSLERIIDPINNQANLVEIYWDKQDALNFPLCINKIGGNSAVNNLADSNSTDRIKVISVARGNVVLVDHGYTIENEELDEVPKTGIFYPKLDKKPITFALPFVSSSSAYSSIYSKQQVVGVYPIIEVKEGPSSKVPNKEIAGVNIWYPRRDLLSSDRFAKEFVVEIDNDGTAYLRFGDGKNGEKPESGMEGNDPVKFFATYRTGSGKIGNIGPETITRVVENSGNQDVVRIIESLRNPLSAIGGTDPESLDEVRQSAPVAFMRQERAVTAYDYASVLRRHPEVQRAIAVLRWTGSWYTVYVSIDRIDGKIVDDSFKQEIYSFLNKFRLAGYDLEINSPIFVPLEIEINVCLKPNHYPEKVKKTLLDIFSTQVFEEGRVGFFHPNNFTFGQPLYLSKIYQTVMNVEGVESIIVTKFKRMGTGKENMELEEGMIQVHHSEIIRLDNDPNFPDNGKIDFVMVGGI